MLDTPAIVQVALPFVFYLSTPFVFLLTAAEKKALLSGTILDYHFPSIPQAILCAVAHLVSSSGSCHKRQKPQAPIRNRQTRKVANAKRLERNTNLA